MMKAMGNHVQEYVFRGRRHGTDRCVGWAARSRERGFTLMEALVVVAILGIVLAVAIPNMQRARVRAHMLEQVRSLKQAAALGRIYAIRNGSTVVLGVPEGSGVTVTMWVDNGATPLVYDDGEMVLERWRIADDVSLAEATDATRRLRPLSAGAKGIVFRADGVVESNVTPPHDSGYGAVELTGPFGNDLRISVLGGPGTTVVEMKDASASGGWTTDMKYWRY
jgi:prepilin-type N-terminal cleavage/methylation domain-containing protein